MDNGLFTHYLLKGLRGEATSKEDGAIRVLNLFAYISHHVPRRKPTQNPLLFGRTTNFPIVP